MDNSTQYDDEIMRYIDGEMGESEKIEFELRLGSNPSLNQALENMQFAKQAVQSFALREKVGSIHQQMMNHYVILLFFQIELVYNKEKKPSIHFRLYPFLLLYYNHHSSLRCRLKEVRVHQNLIRV